MRIFLRSRAQTGTVHSVPNTDAVVRVFPEMIETFAQRWNEMIEVHPET